jgi:SAM-dependent methyltransferase
VSVCAWCGTPLAENSIALAGRRRCQRCGVATTDPWPDDETLAEAYGNWYRPPSGRFSGPGDRLLRKTRGVLARRLDDVAPPGKVLDVGSGDGTLLDALKSRGRQAIGLERVTTRPDVVAGELTDVEDRFAAIVFWHSLEHLRNPASALARAADLLVPGGWLIVAIPNAASLQAQIFGDRWFALDIPRHLVHVPARALLTSLTELGLGVERVSHVRGGQGVFGWLHGFVGWLPGHPDLYDAIRRPEARRTQLTPGQRRRLLAAAAVLLPAAIAMSGLEAAFRRGGTVYVEARKPA